MPDFEKATIQGHLAPKIILFVLFLPNLVLAAFGSIPFSAMTWSIGVEEQFYLIWPWAIKFLKNKFTFIFLLIIIHPLIEAILQYFSTYNYWIAVANKFWYNTPIDCMAIGGLLSLVCTGQTILLVRIKEQLFSKQVQIISLVLLMVLFVFRLKLFFLNNVIYSLLFGITIANLALNKNTIISLEHKWLNYLGRISYGIYMYHGIAIAVVIHFLTHFNFLNNASLYTLSVCLTAILSSVSYHFFEKPFIANKARFSIIKSGKI